ISLAYTQKYSFKTLIYAIIVRIAFENHAVLYGSKTRTSKIKANKNLRTMLFCMVLKREHQK
ncbi:TPA: hypothetical protein QFM34_002651, partial [Enterococcus faecium]